MPPPVRDAVASPRAHTLLHRTLRSSPPAAEHIGLRRREDVPRTIVPAQMVNVHAESILDQPTSNFPPANQQGAGHWIQRSLTQSNGGPANDTESSRDRNHTGGATIPPSTLSHLFRSTSSVRSCQQAELDDASDQLPFASDADTGPLATPMRTIIPDSNPIPPSDSGDQLPSAEHVWSEQSWSGPRYISPPLGSPGPSMAQYPLQEFFAAVDREYGTRVVDCADFFIARGYNMNNLMTRPDQVWKESGLSCQEVLNIQRSYRFYAQGYFNHYDEHR